MKIKWKQLLINIAIPVLTGLLAGLLTRNGVTIFGMLNKPAFAPPAWLFPVVWTILYILMGISSYLIVSKGEEREDVQDAMQAFFWQLLFNFVWPFLFFTFRTYLLAFIWLVILWFMILRTILKFWKISRPAALLLLPYLLWTTFAGFLNLSIYLLN